MKLWLGRLAGYLVICLGIYIKAEYDNYIVFILIVIAGLFIMRLGHPDLKGPFD